MTINTENNETLQKDDLRNNVEKQRVNKHSTNRGLQINIINLFALQQPIDHIWMPFLWSRQQCSISILQNH